MLQSELRAKFPFLSSGKIYFNHAAISPLSTIVTGAINDYLTMRSETDIENFEMVLSIQAEAKEKIARLVHSSADRIAFVDNTSNGLNVIAQGIDWKSGDRVILNDIEFPSNVYPFLNLRSRGVEVDFVKSHSGIVSADDIIAAITPNTRLISVSYVQFLNGYRVDLEKLGEECKKRNILLCVDAIQGLGAFTLDAEKYGIDFIACGTQKWLMGLMGLAFIYISEKLQDILNPKYVGWTSVENTWELLSYDFVLKKTADAFQNGTVSVIGVAAVNASLSLFYEYGMENVSRTILDNAKYFSESLQEMGYKPVLASVPEKELSGIVTFTSGNSKWLFDYLAKANVITSLREGMIRFSPHYYNSREEIDKTIALLKEAEKNF